MAAIQTRNGRGKEMILELIQLIFIMMISILIYAGIRSIWEKFKQKMGKK